MVTREVQSISDLQVLSSNVELNMLSSSVELNNTAFQRQLKESSTSSNETTDEEIVELVQKKPIVTMRSKLLSTKAASDSNFNTIKPKRWSDYRASWNQSFGSNEANDTITNNNDGHLSTVIEVETPVPTTVLEMQSPKLEIEHPLDLGKEFSEAFKQARNSIQEDSPPNLEYLELDKEFTEAFMYEQQKLKSRKSIEEDSFERQMFAVNHAELEQARADEEQKLQKHRQTLEEERLKFEYEEQLRIQKEQQEQLERELFQQKWEQQEQEFLELVRIEQEQQEYKQLEQKQLNLRQIDKDHLEQERQKLEFENQWEMLEKEYNLLHAGIEEQSYQNQELLKQEVNERKRQKYLIQEQERIDREIKDLERLEQERIIEELKILQQQEQLRKEQEQIYLEQLEKQKQEQLEQELLKHQEQLRKEQERIYLEQLERQKQEQLEQELLQQQEQLRKEQERIYLEQLERQKQQEQLRKEQERIHLEQLERQKQEQLDQELLQQQDQLCKEQERIYLEQLERQKQEVLEQEYQRQKIEQQERQRKELEQEEMNKEWERREKIKIEQERQLELEIVQNQKRKALELEQLERNKILQEQKLLEEQRLASAEKDEALFYNAKHEQVCQDHLRQEFSAKELEGRRRAEKLKRKQQTRENLRKEQEKLRLYRQNLNLNKRVYHEPLKSAFLEGKVWDETDAFDTSNNLEQACMSIHLGFPLDDKHEIEIFETQIEDPYENSKFTVEPQRSPINQKITELVFNDYMISFLPGLCYEVLDEDEEFEYAFVYEKVNEQVEPYHLVDEQVLVKSPCPKVNVREDVWRSIPIVIEPAKIEITELSDDEYDVLEDTVEHLVPIKEFHRSNSSRSHSYIDISEEANEDEDSFVSCSDDRGIKIIVTQYDKSNDLSETGQAQVCTLDNLSHTSISDITLSQDSLLVLDPDSPDINKEVEQAFEHGLTIDELHKRDSGNHTATTEYDTDAEESEDEFEQMRAQRMRGREAAPPERDIFEDDTETADFQLKLRHMPQLPQSCHSSETLKETTTEVVSSEVFVEQHIPEHPNDTTEEINKDDIDKCEQIMFPIRQSRSFDSGLPPIAPEVNRLLQATSYKSLSSKSSSVQSVLERRSNSLVTPSPRKQSIEDLASSVENLKEKLLLIPKDSAETIQAVKERLSRPNQSNNGNIIRSRSWQGFSAAHKTARQQAFWDEKVSKDQRYESNSEKDLSLPPPPEKVPEQVQKRLSRSSKSPSRYRQRGYRPLSQSPLRDSSSPARHHIRLSHLIPKERSSSLEGVDQVPKLRQVGLQEKAPGSSSAIESSDSKTAVDSSSSSEDEDEETYSYACVVNTMEQQIDNSNDTTNTILDNNQEPVQDLEQEQMMMMAEQEFEDDGQRRQVKPPNQYFYRDELILRQIIN